MKNGLTIITLFLLYSCNKIDSSDIILPIITEIVCVETDSYGDIKKIVTDNKKQYLVSGYNETQLSPDTVYRVICTYYLESLGTASIISTYNILSEYAIPHSILSGFIKTDPIKLTSIWSGGGYLNIVFQITTLNKVHIISAIDYTEGSKVKFGIYHDAQGDDSLFTKSNYMSIPLNLYNFLSIGDSITFVFNSYDGEEERTIAFK
ncbi:MAG TPA: NigD-like C-terminal domain-containing protein [Bacteroidaceae bacterium]|nr:NigD-like C-terminal domain-containing protein [Bacteroidaceae bacterium]